MDEDVFEFVANTVNCCTENEVDTIGIGNDPVEPDEFIIISRLDEDEQSIDDSIGLITCNSPDEEFSNSIESIELDKTEMFIHLKKDKGRLIGVSLIHIKYCATEFDFDNFVYYVNKITDQSSIKVPINV